MSTTFQHGRITNYALRLGELPQQFVSQILATQSPLKKFRIRYKVPSLWCVWIGCQELIKVWMCPLTQHPTNKFQPLVTTFLRDCRFISTLTAFCCLIFGNKKSHTPFRVWLVLYNLRTIFKKTRLTLYPKFAIIINVPHTL